jgi:hypothetical protein
VSEHHAHTHDEVTPVAEDVGNDTLRKD